MTFVFALLANWAVGSAAGDVAFTRTTLPTIGETNVGYVAIFSQK